jgi:hypothetical protein
LAEMTGHFATVSVTMTKLTSLTPER